MNLTGFHELLASITDVELSALGERADVQSRDCPERDAAEVVSCAFRLVRLRQAFTLLYSEAHMTWLLRYEGIADALVCLCVCVWMDGWMDGWVDGWMHMHLCICIDSYFQRAHVQSCMHTIQARTHQRRVPARSARIHVEKLGSKVGERRPSRTARGGRGGD